jgi:putative autotransporter adhesin-like protein
MSWRIRVWSGLFVGWMAAASVVWAQEGKKSLEAFSELDVSTSANVYVDLAAGAAAEIHGSVDLLQKLTAEVAAGKLLLDSQGMLPAEKDVQVSASDLKVIRLTSSGDIFVKNYKGDHLRIEVIGSGDVTVQGEADSLEVRLVGSGDVKVKDLKLRSAEVDLAGSGDVYVGPTDELHIKLMGSGDVHYSGNPKLTKNVLGSGDVVQD